MAGNFILLPFRESIRAGEFGYWEDSHIAVLPVLIAHENRKTRIARPSLDRIAVLAGVAKRTAAGATSSLQRSRWLTKQSIPLPGGRTRLEYRLDYTPYRERTDQGAWVRLESSLIFQGVWAVMPPSVRKLYLTLLGFSWSSHMAWVPDDGACGDDWLIAYDHEGDLERFVDARYLTPPFLNNAAGLEERTGRRAWSWLMDNGFIIANGEGTTSSPTDLYREGIIMPDVTNLKCDSVLRRLGSVEEITPTPGARSRLTNTRKRQKRAMNDMASQKSGQKQAQGRTLSAVQPDTREPEQVFEQVFEQVLDKSCTKDCAHARCLLEVPND
ncbi:MAG: hypothetical protein H0S80_10675 [Desulfovibrionaceae bacterium]|nr:hypothetical protein [Desulfovibrionaceae bacterium]